MKKLMLTSNIEAYYNSAACWDNSGMPVKWFTRIARWKSSAAINTTNTNVLRRSLFIWLTSIDQLWEQEISVVEYCWNTPSMSELSCVFAGLHDLRRMTIASYRRRDQSALKITSTLRTLALHLVDLSDLRLCGELSTVCHCAYLHDQKDNIYIIDIIDSMYVLSEGTACSMLNMNMIYRIMHNWYNTSHVYLVYQNQWGGP